MKKLLSIIGATSLVLTSITSLVACNKPQEYTKEELAKVKKEKEIKTKHGILEWIAPQEKSFNIVDNKWYFVVCRGDKNNNWEIAKFKNNFNDNKFKVIKKLNIGELKLLYNMDYGKHLQVGYDISKKWISNINNDYFKSVYRWNLDTNMSDLLDIDENGNIKVNGE
ncbi:MAG: lipoprotein [Spiroplasma phoeniceum]|nr:MAG: lipoprotein [Spiroplasma phoeniceum]UZQ32482.1 MAG: lipoprotein [Spiroplasma phoeniceum]